VNLCGNGRVDENESCDDRNRKNGDGCSSNCILEDGWDCSSLWDGRCCEDPLTSQSLGPLFWCGENGFWTSKDGSPFLLQDGLVISEDFTICGNVETISILTVTNGATLRIAGTLLARQNSEIRLEDGQIIITDHCEDDTDNNESQLVLSEGATVSLVGLNPRNTSAPYIWVQRCVYVDGTLQALELTDFPDQDVDLIVSEDECFVGRWSNSDEDQAFHTYYSDSLDGSCSGFYTTRPDDDSYVNVVFDYKKFCPGQIAGISLGAVGGTAVIVGGGAYAATTFGAAGAGASDYYVAL